MTVRVVERARMPEPTPSDHDLQAQLARAVMELSEARTEIKLLRAKVQQLLQDRYGASSEEIDRAQLLLMLQGIEPGKTSEPAGVEDPRRSKDRSSPRK